MQPKSQTLFHFTKSVEFLKGILASGFYPRYSLEDAQALHMGLDYIAYPMVCFCDIPISRIAEHTGFYGEYGLGMTREWGIKNGLQPLLYASPGGKLSQLVRFMDGVTESMDKARGELKELKEAVNVQKYDIIPMIKPIAGTMLIGGKPVEKDFSQENEWRYVPDHEHILFKGDFASRKDQCNKDMEAKKLAFVPSDVRYVFLRSDSEVPAVFDFIQANLGHFPLTDIKILISRITSLETLSRDV